MGRSARMSHMLFKAQGNDNSLCLFNLQSRFRLRLGCCCCWLLAVALLAVGFCCCRWPLRCWQLAAAGRCWQLAAAVAADQPEWAGQSLQPLRGKPLCGLRPPLGRGKQRGSASTFGSTLSPESSTVADDSQARRERCRANKSVVSVVGGRGRAGNGFPAPSPRRTE